MNLLVLVLILNVSINSNAHRFSAAVPDLNEPPIFFDRSLSQKNYELTTLINGRSTECFYQYVQKGMIMELSYKILTGRSRKNLIVIKGPMEEKVHINSFPVRGEMEPTTAKTTGYYEICITCQGGAFGENKVNFDFSYYNKWRVAHKERTLNQTVETTENLLDMVGGIRFKAMIMARYHRFRKLLEGADEMEAEMNLQYVRNISLTVSCIILIVAFIQTYALKWMFRGVGQTTA